MFLAQVFFHQHSQVLLYWVTFSQFDTQSVLTLEYSEMQVELLEVHIGPFIPSIIYYLH